MRNRQNGNVAYYVSIVIIMFFFGCSVEQTHKTLVFFFDGVDKVIFFNDYLSKDSISKVSVAKREALLKKNRPDLCVHKPYKEKKCDQCHTPDKRLLMAMPGLCYKCHDNFSQTYAVVHGPVASGNCTNCHNQHSSKYAKLLIRQGQQICLYCHNSSLVFANKVHRDIEDAECTLCHSPHGGKTRLMLKGNVSRDANRIALMDDLTYRHLYGQIFCKEPGDIKTLLEIYILDSRGTIVATAHPDLNGKFYLANLHPDQNYTFKLKNNIPDCKINIMDNNGLVLFVLEKNKQGKYIFDKASYETVHIAINDAHFLGDTLSAGIALGSSIAVNLDQKKETISGATEVNGKQLVNSDTAVVKGKVAVTPLFDKPVPKDAVALNDSAPGSQMGNTPPNPEAYKGKIKVKILPGNAVDKDVMEADNEREVKSKEQLAKDIAIDSVTYTGKIVVKALPDGSGNEDKKDAGRARGDDREIIHPIAGDAPAKKSKIVVTPLPAGNANALDVRKNKKSYSGSAAARKYEVDGITLTDLTLQIAKFYEGNVVCVLNDSADYLDIATVNAKGEFLLYDFLAYTMTLPDKNSTIVGQTVFLNEKMEVIETINKRVVNGRYVYASNSRETPLNRSIVKIAPRKENALLLATIYFNKDQASVAADGVSGLNSAVEYLNKNPKSRVYLAAHSDSRESIGRNLRLSEERAKAAINYLISKGIKRFRISSKGYGKTKPVTEYEAVRQSEEQNKKNRRVEIYVKDN
jgi:predicted CXXCH cytochrome family protein